MVVYVYTDQKIREPLFYLKHIKDMEPKTILGVTSTCSNTCTIPVGHTGDDAAFCCFRNLLPFLWKCKTKFLEKYKGSLIFGSAYSCRNGFAK